MKLENCSTESPPPYLSHSRINRYLTCPEQYRLYYIERLRPRIDSASLVFGTVIHVAIADLFRTGEDPVSHFHRDWETLKQVQLRYGKRESWEDFNTKGGKLLRQFLDVEAPKIRKAIGVERKFELRVTALNRRFIGSIDLVAQVDDAITVVDFKTATSDYEDHEAILSDQLTAYSLAEPEAEQVDFAFSSKRRNLASSGISPNEAWGTWPNILKRCRSFPTISPPGNSTSDRGSNVPTATFCPSVWGIRRKRRRPS